MSICETKLKSNGVEEWHGVKCVREGWEIAQQKWGKEWVC